MQLGDRCDQLGNPGALAATLPQKSSKPQRGPQRCRRTKPLADLDPSDWSAPRKAYRLHAEPESSTISHIRRDNSAIGPPRG